MSAAKRGRERRDILARLAAPLKPRREPYYVRPESAGWDAPELLPGWWWVPAGADQPEPLGASSTRAQLTLLKLQAQAEAAAGG